MCNEVATDLHSEPSLHMQYHTLVPCCYKDWSQPPPTNATEGLIQGIGGFVHELKEGVSDILYDPVRGIYMHGFSGAAAGLSTGLNSLLSRPLAGGSVLLNKVKAGIQASLAANLQYGVEPSPFDPLTGSTDSGGYALISTTKVHGKTTDLSGDDSAPLILNAQQNNRIRSLKMALPDLPAVYSPRVPAQQQQQQQQEQQLEQQQVSTTQAPTLAESPVALKRRTTQQQLQSPPTSPRGAPTILDTVDHDQDQDQDHDYNPLLASQHSAASQHSSAFYGTKRRRDAHDNTHDHDNDELSDSDDSDYGESDAMPFLLPRSSQQADLTASNISAMTESPNVSQPASAKSTPAVTSGSTPQAEPRSRGLDSLSSAVNHSNDDSVYAVSSPSEPSSAPIIPTAEPAVPVVGAATRFDESCDPLTLLEAFRAAQDAHNLFTALGAESGRYGGTKNNYVIFYIKSSSFFMYYSAHHQVHLCEGFRQAHAASSAARNSRALHRRAH